MMPSQDQLESLAKEIALRFEIADEHLEALENFLCESLDKFNPNRRVDSAARQQIGIRQQLEGVTEAQQYLAEILDGLSPLARDRVWHPLWEMPNRLPNLIGFATLPPATDFPEETGFRETLDAFGRRIEARLVELRTVEDKGGQPENTGLRIWTARAREFWEETLGRKFTYQYFWRVHKGEAFAFCFFVLQRIAPNVSEKALATAMRAVIKPMKVTFRIFPSRELQ
jgi:hypothetical protein